jgi:hypothetical protein
VIYTTLGSAFTTGISLRAATPAKISGRIDDEAVDRHLNLIDEETTALQKGNRCAGQIPSRGRSGKPVEIGGSSRCCSA